MPVLAVQGLCVRPGGGKGPLGGAGLTLAVEAGELVALCGPSGVGKTAVLRCLAGLDVPAAGAVLVGGAAMTGRSATERARLRARSVGLLFRTDNFFERLTLAEHLTLLRRLTGRPTDRRLAAAALTAVGLTGRSGAYPRQLSAAEAARAALAVALANGPTVLLADEPTGDLDSSTGDRILGLLRTRARAGTAVLLATRDRRLAAAADRTVALTGRAVAA